MTGTASDDTVVARVELQVDGGAFGLASGTTSWRYDWNTAAVTDGSHTVAVRATDGAGNTIGNLAKEIAYARSHGVRGLAVVRGQRAFKGMTGLITAGLLLVLTLADRTVLSLFMGPDSPALPIARHIHLLASWNFLLFGVMMVLFATVRANGAVWAPLIILAIGLVPVRFGYILLTYGWLGADAIWTSFPVTSLINLTLATAYYLNGSWKKARMTVQQYAETDECTEEALATREPGGALNPAG